MPGRATCRALPRAETSGDRYEQARALDGVAVTCERAGEPEQARRFLERAVRLYAALGVPGTADARARLAALPAPTPVLPGQE